MKIKPILFSESMVRAILREIEKPGSGKTETRRILKPQPYPLEGRPGFWNASGTVGGRICVSDRDILDLHHIAKPGDRLYVRESVRAVDDQDTYDFQIEYLADGWRRKVAEHDDRSSDAYGDLWPLFAYRSNDPDLTGGRHIPSMHMPRWASRLTLVVEDVKIERLQNISDEAARREGVEPAVAGADEEGRLRTYRTGFVRIWREIYGADAWTSNPWVVVTRFRPYLCNVDAMDLQ